MKPANYSLTIFEPAHTYEPLVNFESSSPFVNIEIGSLINQAFWPQFSERDDLKDKILRVVGVEHGIQEFDEHILHVICVFTEAVDNTEDVRLRSVLW